MNKYKLGDKHPTENLYRVVALRDFGAVVAGQVGGWVESEKNLSQLGNCWVWDSAQVYGNARVYDNAYVYDSAQVSDNARVYGDAQVSGNAWASGRALVSGNAWVSGRAQVSGDARVSGRAQVSGDAVCSATPLYVSGLQYHVTVTDKHIQIGCKQWPLPRTAKAVDKIAMENGLNKRDTRKLNKLIEFIKEMRRK